MLFTDLGTKPLTLRCVTRSRRYVTQVTWFANIKFSSPRLPEASTWCEAQCKSLSHSTEVTALRGAINVPMPDPRHLHHHPDLLGLVRAMDKRVCNRNSVNFMMIFIQLQEFYSLT